MSNIELSKQNPANAPRTERDRVPMSLPLQKLAVPEIEGYHCHWMLGMARVNQALRAGYEFVDPEETELVNTGLADDASRSGHTDLGSRVSVSAGTEVGSDGSEQRLYLMKLRNEWWEADQASLEARNETIAAAIRGGESGDANPNGMEKRYVPQALAQENSNILVPKKNRRI